MAGVNTVAAGEQKRNWDRSGRRGSSTFANGVAEASLIREREGRTGFYFLRRRIPFRVRAHLRRRKFLRGKSNRGAQKCPRQISGGAPALPSVLEVGWSLWAVNLTDGIQGIYLVTGDACSWKRFDKFG